KSVDSLDLCIDSLIRGQNNQNEIIVVVDGTYELNKDILKKYENQIKILNLEENMGTARATNLGVFNATNEAILIINDDNVAPEAWDYSLLKNYKKNRVIAPNQIEPFPSMFKQFLIKYLGRDPKTFSLEGFYLKSVNINEDKIDNTGSTFPIFMNKFDYLKVGGLDESYPSPSGFVADWEFFMKCQMCGMEMVRDYNSHFYHFVSLSAKSEEQKQQSAIYEQNCHGYAKYKWGNYIQHNPDTNLKYV
ncbi:MAG: glycosyltransferase, partial [Nanoarchaeota archaeon]